jgi:hypothetical protein
MQINKPGPVSYSVDFMLDGTTATRSWSIYASGVGDEVVLSDPLKLLLESEHLPYLEAQEVFANQHLVNVLDKVEYVPSISIHHLLNPVEPLMGMQSLHTEAPPPLTQDTLQTFKKWYHGRVPLKFTAESVARDKDDNAKWQRLERLLL